MRTDSGDGTHEFVEHCHNRRLHYSVGFTLSEVTAAAIDLIPADRPDRLATGMRVIVRKERPHSGVQVRFTSRDGRRQTAFATNTTRRQLPDLELRHSHRARCEERIRTAEDTDLANLHLHGFEANRIWIEIVCLATELTPRKQTLAVHDHRARRWDPNRLRLWLFSLPPGSPAAPGCTSPWH